MNRRGKPGRTIRLNQEIQRQTDSFLEEAAREAVPDTKAMVEAARQAVRLDDIQLANASGRNQMNKAKSESAASIQEIANHAGLPEPHVGDYMSARHDSKHSFRTKSYDPQYPNGRHSYPLAPSALFGFILKE